MAYFLINTPKRSAKKKKKKRGAVAIPRTVRKGLRRKAAAAGERWYGVNSPSLARRAARRDPTPSTRSTPMAKKRRTRTRKANGQFVKRRATAAANPRRRRTHQARRNPATLKHALIMNPRRRRSVARANPHRRRRHGMRRNPPMLAALKQGVMDGGAVFVGGWANRRLTGAIQGLIPAAATGTAGVSPMLYTVVPQIGAAVAISYLGNKFAPRYSRMLAAGAFAQAIGSALSLTPLAPFLGALPARRFVRGGGAGNLRAWPGTGMPRVAGAQGMAAWPRRVMPMPQTVGT
jgi:hypothetical protein